MQGNQSPWAQTPIIPQRSQHSDNSVYRISLLHFSWSVRQAVRQLGNLTPKPWFARFGTSWQLLGSQIGTNLNWIWLLWDRKVDRTGDQTVKGPNNVPPRRRIKTSCESGRWRKRRTSGSPTLHGRPLRRRMRGSDIRRVPLGSPKSPVSPL